jgi:uncharacterized protein YecE (DUF72 family)
MMIFDYARVQRSLRSFAAQGVFIGTSSWKYPGWIGTVYDEQRYVYPGKVSDLRFQEHCLEEYAALFPTVCVDAAYYRFPESESLLRLAGQVPPGFRFAFKVTDDITVKRFPKLPRFGPRGGQPNPHFLDAELFQRAFLAPCGAIRNRTGLLIFEFSHFSAADFLRGRDFMAALSGFLEKLPEGWDYGVEIRNRTFLHPDYFAMLASFRVTHVFNSWSDMPSVTEQWEMPGSITRPECVGARLLLKPGRNYQEAVDTFQPYSDVLEPLPKVRQTAADLILRGRKLEGGHRSYIYVNNRLEGNAPGTIAAILEMAGG